MRTIALLTISNVFMTFAWYGHLKYREVPLYKVIVLSWLIAFFEYCFQVPANRIGSYEFSAAQLKTIQEVITLVVTNALVYGPTRPSFATGLGPTLAKIAGTGAAFVWTFSSSFFWIWRPRPAAATAPPAP